MKLSQLIALLRSFSTSIDDPEVVYWNAELDAHEKIIVVTTIVTPNGVILELSGECQ